MHTTDEYNYFLNMYIQRVDGKVPSFAPKVPFNSVQRQACKLFWLRQDFGKPGLYNASAIAQLISAHPVLTNVYLKQSSTGSQQSPSC